jgi:hypothetical protein
MLTGIGLCCLAFASAMFAYGRHVDRTHRAWMATQQARRQRGDGTPHYR